MERREFLKKTGVTAAAVAGAALSAPAVIASEKTYRWKMVTTWPPGLPVLQTGAERFAKRLEEVTGGRIKIQVFAGGELVPPLGVFDAVSDGTVEVGSGASYYWAGQVPAGQWFSSGDGGLLLHRNNAGETHFMFTVQFDAASANNSVDLTTATITLGRIDLDVLTL